MRRAHGRLLRSNGPVRRNGGRVESLFLDEPRAGLVAAQALVTRIRATRGAAGAGAAPDDERYDRACAVVADERATTEEMREALLRFRAIFNGR